MNNTQIDEISRKKIREEINSNFFVEAGAGSGKTTILVERMYNMVENGIDISKICAITFTKAAADEFYNRFQAKLSQSENQNAKNALKNIDLCFMGTIDSFCNLIISEHPIDAGLPFSSNIINKDESDKLYLQKISEIANGNYGKELQEKCWRFKNSVPSSENAFINTINILLSIRNSNLHYSNIPSDKFTIIYKKEIDEIKKIVAFMKSHTEIQNTGDKKSREAWKAIEEESQILFEDWDDDLYKVYKFLKKINSIRIVKEFDIKNFGIEYNKFFEPYPNNDKIKYWKIRSDNDPLLISEIENYQFLLCMDFVNAATNLICDELKKEGKLSFFDYLLYLRDMLKNDATKSGKLIDHIYNRHSYFLIDEFQDTNPLQAEIFFYLCAQKPCADWTKCIPKPGSLFVVGDPKQSIYRFRNADVNSFLRVKNLFVYPVGEVLELSRNFRSTNTMCEYFNNTFCRLLSTNTDTQCKYAEIPISITDNDTSSLKGAYKYTFEYKEKNNSPSIVTNIISNIVQNPEFTIFDKKQNITRQINYKDIMLITASKPHLIKYMTIFTNNNIPFYVEGNVLFEDCPALISAYYILNAIAMQNNNAANYGATELSLCNISFEDINYYFNLSRIMPTSSLLSKIIEDRNIIAFTGSHNLEYLFYAIELIKDKEANYEITNIKECAEFIQSLIFEDNDIERYMQLTTESNRIHLANLHKVKGLEAPVVILASSSNKKKEAAYSIDYSTEIPQSYIFKVEYSSKDWPIKCYINSKDFLTEKEKEEEHLEAENTRLLYVAATRACNALIIANMVDSKGVASKSNNWAPLLNNVDKEFTRIDKRIEIPNKEEFDALKLYVESKNNSPLNNTTPNNSSYTINKPSSEKENSIYTEFGDNLLPSEFNINKEEDEKSNSALIGTMVHKLMEMIVQSRANINIDNAVCDIVHKFNVDKEQYFHVLNNIANKMLSGGYSFDLIKEIKNAEEVYCEMPFAYKNNSIITNGIIDLIYCSQGNWHIIDYKTNANPKDLDIKYKKQLEEYKNAFFKITGNEADVKIYHIPVNL